MPIRVQKVRYDNTADFQLVARSVVDKEKNILIIRISLSLTIINDMYPYWQLQNTKKYFTKHFTAQQRLFVDWWNLAICFFRKLTVNSPAFPVDDACIIVTIKGCPTTFQTHPVDLQFMFWAKISA